MSRGISGDMFSAACYSFMDQPLREEFLKQVEKGCRELGGRVELRENCCGTERGYAIAYVFPSVENGIAAREASVIIDRIVAIMELSPDGKKLTATIFSDIVRAESKAHGVGTDAVHLHEIGRPSGLMNIASAGLCYDLLEIGERELIGTAISVGKGTISTEHGRHTVPAPASSNLLAMLKSRPGPYEGEMATPTGIAIVKNLISKQIERLPMPGRQGIGFGSKCFEGVVGYTRLFEKDEPINGGG